MLCLYVYICVTFVVGSVCLLLHLFVKLHFEHLSYCFRPRKNAEFKGRAEEVWAAVARLAWCCVYPVCIIWDYTCQGTVNKDSVHLLHTVLDPGAKSAYE